MNVLGPLVASAILSLMFVVSPQTLPVGTALPIMVNSTLEGKNAKVGQKIVGKLMQDVPVSPGFVVKKGAQVTGHVVAVQRPTLITVQFTQLEYEHQAIPINVSLRALASSLDVFQAAVPVGASTSEASNEWVTQQVGGDYVFRGRGYITSDQGKVGRWDGNGVWGKLLPGNNCPDDELNQQEQALWVFSVAACGAYGYDKKMTVTHDGHTAPFGQITLQATAKTVEVRAGSGWLLLVNRAAKTGDNPKP
jgi:hypothetical protein